MNRPILAASLLLAALLAASCQDENGIERSESFTGLWTIEPSAAEALVFQWEQDGAELRGEMYVESFLGTEGPYPLSEGRVSGQSVSWSLRPADTDGTDSLHFRGDLDTPNVVRGNLTICTELALDDTTMIDTCMVLPVTAVRDASGF